QRVAPSCFYRASCSTSSSDSYRVHRDLHSFPTRRSSDLSGSKHRKAPATEQTVHSQTELLLDFAMGYLGTRYRYGGNSPREGFRSEEHTSELQSRENLVCRLLLDKKKQTMRRATGSPPIR